MNIAHIAFIAKQRLPLEFNTIVVREDGSLEQHLPGRPVEFRFTYRALPFRAQTRLAKGRTVLHLSGEVGPIPYSAESVPIRRGAHAILQASRSLRHTRLSARPDARIGATGAMRLRTPLTPVAIMAAVTTMILELDPYLALLAEVVPSRGTGAAQAADPETAAPLPATPPPH